MSLLNNLRLNPSDIFNNDFQVQGFGNTVVKGSLVLVLSQIIIGGLAIANTMVLARLLTPSDFGIIGMVTVFINFLLMFKDAGLSMATIQNEKIDSGQISTLFWINAIISLTLGIVVLLSSPMVAAFYKKPELAAVTAVLSVSFVIEGFFIQHSALLRRHLKFSALAVIEVIAQLGSMIAAIAMALLGFHYWALVGAVMARTVTLLILMFYFCPWIPGRMEKGTGVRDMLKFGGHITGSAFVVYLSRNFDSLLIGRYIGAAPLGLYSRAYSLLMQPLTMIRGSLTNISLPVMSSLKNDPARYLKYFSKLLDISISLTLPIMVYCFLESKFLVRILLGQNWMEAEPVFKIFSLAGFFIANLGIPGLVLLSYGFSKRYLHLNIITSLIICVSFVAGVQFGITGVAIGYGIASIIILIPFFYFGFRGTHLKLRLVFESIRGPLFSASVAGISAYFFLIFYSNEDILKHVLTGLIFFIIYTFLTLLRPNTRETFRFMVGSFFSK